MKDFLDLNWVSLAVFVVGGIGAWYTVKNSTAWHTDWIKKHSEECDEQRQANNEILAELRETNARLVAMAESHEQRLNRLEGLSDRGYRHH